MINQRINKFYFFYFTNLNWGEREGSRRGEGGGMNVFFDFVDDVNANTRWPYLGYNLFVVVV